jgi:hypothetical protein
MKTAHQMVLPMLWFLQVSRMSDLTTRETTNGVYYFTFTAFKPIGRLLVSQVLVASILMLLLAAPLLFRLGVSLNGEAFLAVVFGALFIVMLAALLGILTKGKKLFEVVFFMMTYANINGIPFVDYFGGYEHHRYYLAQLTFLVITLMSVTFLMRKKQLKK